MKTIHKIIFSNSKQMKEIESSSIDLGITSPPYPMITLWDESFANQNPAIGTALEKGDGTRAFELMHQELDCVWDELYRVLKSGGIACINIGDATRTIDNNFQLFPNHARILSHCLHIGFQSLPEIIWRKQTNAPNKFMGSGMLPPGAYVTLEHEFILILRKGRKREFKSSEEKGNRKQSSYFWEERNNWFSDVWDFKGIDQKLDDEKTRERSAAYPFELAYRLINMFSVKEDIVLDPFLGTGTTMIAAMCAERNSVGYELDSNLLDTISLRVQNVVEYSNNYIQNRLKNHLNFVSERLKAGKPLKHVNEHYGFPIITKQETDLVFHDLKKVTPLNDHKFEVTYDEGLQIQFENNKVKNKSLTNLSKWL
ncbi:MAG: DNA-methyltransferase [Candidatus Hermodarchaeota archaeon]